MALRVVAGSCRGRRLRTPEGESTRPTADRVREATFNSLDAQGLLAGARVLDLFAGSGAVGIEALSRGAEHATFVDISRDAMSVVGANVATCGFESTSTLHRGDWHEFLRREPVRFDLAYLDPPYAFEHWNQLLELVKADAVVIESDRLVLDSADYGDMAYSGYEVTRQRRYGTTFVTIAVSRRPARDLGQEKGTQ